MRARSVDVLLLALGLLPAMAAAGWVTAGIPQAERLLDPVAESLPLVTRLFFVGYSWWWLLPVVVLVLWLLPILRPYRGVVTLVGGWIGALVLFLLFRWAMALPLQVPPPVELGQGAATTRPTQTHSRLR